MPMFYTQLGSMNYSGSFEPSISQQLNLSNTGVGPSPFQVSGGGSDGGTAVFDALIGEKFYKAILKSIDPATVRFYRQQGWPDSLLYSLFVERLEFSFNPMPDDPKLNDNLGKLLSLDGVEYVAADIKNHLKEAYAHKGFVAFCRSQGRDTPEKTAGEELEKAISFLQKALVCTEDKIIVDNDPDNPHRYLLFRFIVSSISNKAYWTVETHTDKNDNKPHKICDGSTTPTPSYCGELEGYAYAFDLESLANVTQTDFSLDKKSMKVIDNKVFTKIADKTCILFTQIEAAPTPKNCTTSPFPVQVVTDDTGGTNNQNKINIVLRSPNSMLYYLGELLRAQSETEFTAQKDGEKKVDVIDYISFCEKYTNSRFADKNNDEFLFGADTPCTSRQHLASLGNSAAQTDDNKPDNLEKQENLDLDDHALFYLMTRNPKVKFRDKGLFDFKFNDVVYYVSEDNQHLRGRTLQAVTLINEIFFSFQEASDAPAVTILDGRSF